MHLSEPISPVRFSDTDTLAEFDHPRPDRVVAGNPLRTTRNHYQREGMAAGEWCCETGAWRIAFADNKDEFFHVISGRLRITDPTGRACEFAPGDSGIIPAGFSGVFEVLEPVRKHYVIVEQVDYLSREQDK